MSAAEVTESRTSTGVKYLLCALVVLPDQESDSPLENRLPEVQSGKTFGPETEGVGHDLGLRGGESPRGLALGQAAKTRAGVRAADPEPDSRGGKLGVGVASQIGIHTWARAGGAPENPQRWKPSPGRGGVDVAHQPMKQAVAELRP